MMEYAASVRIGSLGKDELPLLHLEDQQYAAVSHTHNS